MNGDQDKLRNAHSKQDDWFDLVSRNSELARANIVLEAAKKRFSDLFELAPVGYVVLDERGRILDVNQVASHLLKTTKTSLLNVQFHSFIAPRDSRKFIKFVESILLGATRRKCEFRLCVEAETLEVEMCGLMSEDLSRNHVNCLLSVSDVTEHKRMEEQIHQLQRLEAIGSLVGGVSHEFKNLLMGISAYTEVLQLGLGKDHPQIGLTNDLLHCVDRARKLVDQLLAFGKHQVIDTHPADVNDMVRESASLVEKLLGEQIVLDLSLWPEPVVANLDTGQIVQVIVNLVLNAKEAMPHGGILGLRTGKVSLASPSDSGEAYHTPTHYAEIVVSDTGIGMDDLTRKRIFEPFFSTKHSAGHTGMGLALAYGIVRQHGGHIQVTSDVGAGSAFRLRMPLASEEPDASIGFEQFVPTGGHELILLLEDEAIIQTPVKLILESYGYEVITAKDGAEAADIFQERGSEVALVVTDLIVPRISGVELYRMVKAVSPETRFLFMSGYAPSSVDESLIPPPFEPMIAKPFPLADLVGKVREILDSRN